jgi:hypothetical protein
MKSFKQFFSENIGGIFKDASEWEKSAKARGLVVKSMTHPSGEMTKYQIAKDKEGNNRGHFDHGTKSGHLKEEVELNENPWNQRLQKKPGTEELPAPSKGAVEKHGKKFKEGDMVVPHTGPHAGVPHKVTYARTGSVNILPMVSINQHKYNNTTIRAKHEHLSPYKPVKEEVELDEDTMPGNVALRLVDRHQAAAFYHKKNGNMKGYAAHFKVAMAIEDSVIRAGRDMPIRSKRLEAASDKVFKEHPHSLVKK